MVTTGLLTVQEFLELPRVKDDDYRRYELWQGEVVEMGETIPFHNWIREKMLVFFSNFLAITKLGEVLVERGIQLDTNTLYRPDLAYWDRERWAAIDLHKSPVYVIPQLVVEVKSPSNTAPELFGKAHYYLRSGVHTAWVVIDDPYAIHIFEADGGRRVIHAGGILDAPAILPGFSAEASQFLPLAR